MTFGPGTRIGPYVIDDALDAGAMGEVYRATDTRLGRRVAVKILPPGRADQKRRARFLREAQAVSRLSHPHLCPVYDVGEHDGIPFLVMEYLDGETLSRRLLRGALPLAEAIRIACDIAAALDHAHREGVVHRDLKPANVMLTGTGAKLLDFGLADLESPLLDEASPPDSAGTGATESLTSEGAILGTIQYMSPEQGEGFPTDGRSDIFALGAILYEMVSGRPAFQGTSKAGILAAVLERTPPPITADHDPGASAALPLFNEIVSKCLAKRPADRWQAASDLKDALGWVVQRTGDRGAATRVADGTRRSRRLTWAAGVLLLIAVPATMVLWRHRNSVGTAVWFEIPPPDHSALNPASAFLALSPDGDHLAFIASSREGGRALWLRRLDSVVARQLPGTDEAYQPFWSPDSRFIAFGAEGRLKTIDIETSVVRTLTHAFITTGTWNAAGQILFTPGPNERRLRQGTVYEVPAAAGEPRALPGDGLRPDGVAYAWPTFLPDGRRFLVLERSEDPKMDATLAIESREADHRRVQLFQTDSHAVFAAGHLLFMRGGRLLAQPFDPRSLKTTGEPAIIAEDVELNDPNSRRGAFTVSGTGVLAYRAVSQNQLAWFDRHGRRSDVLGESGRYRNPALSPDEQRVAVERADPRTGRSDIWMVDAQSGVASRFTDTGAGRPLWSPQADRIIYRTTPPRGAFISRTIRGGVPDETLLTEVSPFDNPVSALPDGRAILYTVFDDSPTAPDLWLLSTLGDYTPAAVMLTPYAEIDGRISPDGRWLAYVSNEAGPYDVYVRPYPSGAAKWRLSTGGGIEPVWRRDGRELFYLAADRWLMSVDIETATGFTASSPVRLFQTQLSTVVSPAYTRNQFAVSADGERFLLCEPTGSPTPITVIVNWPARLRGH